jgi:superfamily II DNA or RNA helicase
VEAVDGSSPDGVTPLFRPPFKLFDFQAEFAARCYYNDATILAADTGCGKSVISTATACMLVEDGKIDHILIAAEKNKIWEWYDDIGSYSNLERAVYTGDKAKRQKLRDNLPPVLIGTFETLRNDLAQWEETTRNKRGKTLINGLLLNVLEEKRVLVILDEGPAKIGAQRTSLMYQAYERLAKKCRKLGEMKIIVCSATYVDRDPRGFHNVAHLLWPDRVGTVESFNNEHVASWDYWGNPVSYKNLHSNATEPGKVALLDKIGEGSILVKSKLDPDIKDKFPEMAPDVTFVRLSKAERDFYKWMVKEYGSGNSSNAEKSVWMALRQFCGHPHSLFTSEGEVAKDVVRRRADDLEKLGCAKLEALVERLGLICNGQGAQAVVFTWFGQSILPIVGKELVRAGFTVSLNHGQMSGEERARSQATWRAGGTQIYLSSDAGSRGINLPEGQYVEQYEAATKYSTYVQRVNRVSRINSTHKIVVDHTWVVKDSIEEPILELQNNRQEWSEGLGTKNTLSVDQIREMIQDRRNYI